jgi:hypothetical protein
MPMSMPETSVPGHGDRDSCSPEAPGRRRSSTSGRSRWTPSPAIRRQDRSSRGAVRKVHAPVRRACIPGTYAASGPGPETWKGSRSPATEQPGIRSSE